MKLVKIIALGLVLSLGIVACSSSSTTSSESGADATATNGADSADSSDSADSGNGDSSDGSNSGGDVSGGSSAYCEQVAKIFEENQGTFDEIDQEQGGVGTDLAAVEAAYKKNMGVLADLMNQIADISPGEIKADVQTVADGYQKAADAGVTGSAAAFNTEGFLQATQNWGQYMIQSCSLTDIPVPGF